MKLISTLAPKSALRTHSLRRTLEALEPREVPSATLSVGDAAAVEGDGTMKFIDAFVAPGSGGLDWARGLDYGPDGNLYVSGEGDNSVPGQAGYVNRYDAVTGAFIDRFASDPTMTGAKDVEFGPDGNLYVPNNYGDNIYRFNGTTGAFMDIFVPTGSGGLDVPRSVIFGPDGNGDGNRDLYVTSAATSNVLRYDGVTGAFINAFVPAGSGGLTDPTALVFGPDGNLYVASGAHTNYYNSILKYNGTTGAFMGVFVPAGSAGLTLAPTAGVIFGPDANGDGYRDLYVSNGGVNEVLIYNGLNGSFVQKYVSPGLGGLVNPKGLLFDRDGNLLVISANDNVASSVLRYGPGSLAAFTVSLSEPSAGPVTVDYATASGSATSGSDFAATSGTLTFAPGQTSRTILVPTLNDAAAEGNETFTLVLSNPVGATIADGTGVGTIADDDGTKFYVADDGGTDRTYRYGAPGNGLGNSALGSGNTAPRGAASTAAGDRVWVVDANKKVYVYDAAGTLLGSWTAGSLASNAQVEGITTNGTDIWIVDNKQNKVFKYAGAATRLSGSQNAASSFNLNSSNTSPKDLVTDGASIWVVNDTWFTDKVFKYTLAGSHLGNWTLSGGGGSPTGITLDPSAPAHLWIVDNATDQVYQYDNAVGRTSSSQSASTSFALAAGNTNPQGIADPPANGAVPLDSTARHGRKANDAARRDVVVAPVAGNWLPPEAYDWAPIDVSPPRGKAKRA